MDIPTVRVVLIGGRRGRNKHHPFILHSNVIAVCCARILILAFISHAIGGRSELHEGPNQLGSISVANCKTFLVVGMSVIVV